MEFIIKIENQNVNGVDYTAEQFLQGLEQVVSDYNERTGEENLTNAEWLQWAHYQNLAAWFEYSDSASFGFGDKLGT